MNEILLAIIWFTIGALGTYGNWRIICDELNIAILLCMIFGAFLGPVAFIVFMVISVDNYNEMYKKKHGVGIFWKPLWKNEK